MPSEGLEAHVSPALKSWAQDRARIHFDRCLRGHLQKFIGDRESTRSAPSFDAAAACALYNSGDRESWRLYPEDGYLVQQDGEGLVRVSVNPDGTVEPKQS
jgi:hypothetical protein